MARFTVEETQRYVDRATNQLWEEFGIDLRYLRVARADGAFGSRTLMATAPELGIIYVDPTKDHPVQPGTQEAAVYHEVAHNLAEYLDPELAERIDPASNLVLQEGFAEYASLDLFPDELELSGNARSVLQQRKRAHLLGLPAPDGYRLFREYGTQTGISGIGALLDDGNPPPELQEYVQEEARKAA